jgi:hypothetical protein
MNEAAFDNHVRATLDRTCGPWLYGSRTISVQNAHGLRTLSRTYEFPRTGDLVTVFCHNEPDGVRWECRGGAKGVWVLSLLEGKTRDDAGVMR